MINRLSICLAVAMTLLLGSCAVTDINHDVNFKQYRTFGFSTADIQVSNPAYKSGLISSKIRKDVITEFEKHGLVYSKANPDLLVSYTTFTQDKQQNWSGYGGYPMMMGWGWRGPMYWGYPYMGYGGYGGGYPYHFTEGTLIIDITDAKTNEQVWRGLVKGNVNDIKALSKSIDKGVKAIIKKYPGTT
ncbi:MAG: DUF4136 domain-containing protein [Bacteroidota bacterium]